MQEGATISGWAAAAGSRTRRRFWWRAAATAFKYGVLTLGAVTMVIPFLDMFAGALKTEAELIAVPPPWLPARPAWENFTYVWTSLPFQQWYLNSLIVTSAVTASVLLTSTMGGFALAKYRFPGRDLIFKTILAAQMFPMFLFLIPNYLIMARFPLAGGNDLFGHGGSGLLGTYLALILPFTVNWWGIFLMRQFMLGLPNELLDAARIDGCSEFRIYWQVVLPLVKPALATLAVFTFIVQWNEFLWTYTVTQGNQSLATVPVGIQFMRDTFNPIRGAALRRAAVAIASVPVMVLFVALQRYYTRGIVMSGLKG